MSQHHLYVSGPMSGLPEFNFPAFVEATSKLERAGFKVTNPSALSLPCGCSGPTQCRPAPHEYHEYLRMCLQALVGNDISGIALLPGWENSKGAAVEMAVGRALGWPVQPVGFWLGEAHLLRLEPGSLLVARAPRPGGAPPSPPPVRAVG